MFGFGKNYKRVEHTLTYWVVGSFTFAIEALLGLNAAFLIDAGMVVMVRNMLSDTSLEGFSSWIALVGAGFFGFCLMLGGLWTFAGFMDNLSDFEAYALVNKSKAYWPVILIWAGVVAIMILDYCTLAFRMAYFQSHGAEPLFWFFCVLIPLPLLLGVVMHISKHVPHDQQARRAQDYAVSLSAADIQHAVREMDPDLREQFAATGDTSLISEHYARVDTRNREYDQQKIHVDGQKQIDKANRHRTTKHEGLRIAPFQVVGPKNQANGADHKSA